MYSLPVKTVPLLGLMLLPVTSPNVNTFSQLFHRDSAVNSAAITTPETLSLHYLVKLVVYILTQWPVA